MKKIILASSLLLAGGMANAAGGSLAAGSNTVLAASGCGTPTMLTSDVKITLSAANLGYYDCDTAAASIGVAIANTSGKNKVYSLGSAGGGITETTLSSAPTTTDAQTAATARSASS